MKDQVRAIVSEYGKLSLPVEALADDADLYQAGLTSHASVNVMLALEDAFGVEFPDRLLRRRSFESIAAICAVLAEVTGGRVAATAG